MVLLIDNYDSFTYNLVQSFQALGVAVQVLRNNHPLETIPKSSYLVIGPGPGTPSQAGISKALIRQSLGKIPILGVCLGHQAIAEIFGGSTKKALKPVHGKISPITHDGQGLFANLPNPLNVVRYNSLIIDRDTVSSAHLAVTAETAEGEIMALRHKIYAVESVQFHPDSIATQNGIQILENFLKTNQPRSSYA